ncbi:MAG: HAD family phosphatase [Paludibacteraceae bacterium]|nr:HAD family phosphatase [Paludibacteraceae bacterium]
MKHPFEPPVCKYGPPPHFWRPRSKYDTLIFDLGGVLMKHNMQGCIAAFTELLGEDGVQQYLGLASNGEGAADSLMIQFEQGLVSAEQFVSEVLKHCQEGTTEQQVTDAWLRMHAGIPADRLEYVRSLRRQGFQTYLLSNNNELHWQDVLDHYPIADCFDRVFLSHEMHLSKPDPRMFVAIAEELVTEPERTIFIDDIEENRVAANLAVGWKTCAGLDELRQMLQL